MSFTRHEEGARFFKILADVAPAMGMIGTLIGLVAMLANMDDPKAIGPAMSVALLTTLYGAFAANFLFLPFADKLKGKNEAKKVEDALTTTGVLLIAQKKHSIEIRDSLNAYLPPRLRKKDEE